MNASENPEKFFEDHGVAPEVWRARPYIKWTADDPQPVRDAYKRLGRGQRQYMTSLATQSDGLVIVRHAPFGLGLPHVFAEIRPDEPVKTQPPR